MSSFQEKPERSPIPNEIPWYVQFLLRVGGENPNKLQGDNYEDSRRKTVNQTILTICAAVISTMCMTCGVGLIFQKYWFFVSIFSLTFFALTLTIGVGLLIAKDLRQTIARSLIFVFVSLAIGECLTILALYDETSALARQNIAIQNDKYHAALVEKQAVCNHETANFQKEIAKLEAEAAEFQRLAKSEKENLGFESRRLGNESSVAPGMGVRFKFYMEEAKVAKEQADQARQRLEEFQANSSKELALLKSQQERLTRDQNETFPQMLKAYFQLLDSKDPYTQKSTIWLSALLKLLCVTFELLPALLKAVGGPTTGMLRIIHNDEIGAQVLDNLKKARKKLLKKIMEEIDDEKVSSIALVDAVQLLQSFEKDMDFGVKAEPREKKEPVEDSTQPKTEDAAAS